MRSEGSVIESRISHFPPCSIFTLFEAAMKWSFALVVRNKMVKV